MTAYCISSHPLLSLFLILFLACAGIVRDRPVPIPAPGIQVCNKQCWPSADFGAWLRTPLSFGCLLP